MDGDRLTIGNIAATLMACEQGMEIEAAFLKALERVRGWKILARLLDLYDAQGNLLARFEARASQ